MNGQRIDYYHINKQEQYISKAPCPEFVTQDFSFNEAFFGLVESLVTS